jgi:hypothetical protein
MLVLIQVLHRQRFELLVVHALGCVQQVLPDIIQLVHVFMVGQGGMQQAKTKVGLRKPGQNLLVLLLARRDAVVLHKDVGQVLLPGLG